MSTNNEINYATIVNAFNTQNVETKIDKLVASVNKIEKSIKSIIKVQNTTLELLHQINNELFSTDIEYYTFINDDPLKPAGVISHTLDRNNQNNYLNYACTRMYDITGDLSWICGFYMILKNNKQDIDLLFKRLEKLDIDICDKQYNDIRKAFENYFETSFVSIDLENESDQDLIDRCNNKFKQYIPNTKDFPDFPDFPV